MLHHQQQTLQRNYGWLQDTSITFVATTIIVAVAVAVVVADAAADVVVITKDL
jgi:hypothetical protein